MAIVKFGNSNRAAVDHLVNDFLSPILNDSFLGERFISKVPAVNIAESNDAYFIELASPGLNKEDFKINLDGEVLTISAEKKSVVEEESKKYSKREYSYTAFTRSFNLPEGIDHNNVSASYTDGILKVMVGKKEEVKIASTTIQIS